MRITKKIIYLLVMSCSGMGLFFSIIGFTRFPEHKILFLIAIYSCIIGIMVAISEIVDLRRHEFFDLYKIILGSLSGIALILASIYLIFITNVSIFMKLICIFGILFFSLCIIKGMKIIKTEYNREIIIPLEYRHAFEKAKVTLKKSGVIIIQENEGEGLIVARTNISWKSFGEEITTKFTKLGNGKTKIIIFSKPMVSILLVDFGKNIENVEKFCTAMSTETK